MENITELNIGLTKKEMYKLINTWNARNITPLGKITLIKSLLISKITHVLLSLPTPSNNAFDELEKHFKILIWNGKTPKFRREILETTISTGGFKLTNLRVFDEALKISWLKRFKNEEDGLEEFPRKYNIQNIILFGNKYPEKIRKTIKNKFWENVITACQSMQNKLSTNNTWAFNIPLRYNSLINFEFRNKWYTQGIVWVKYNIQNLNMRNKDINSYGLHIPYLLFKIGYGIKGCSKIYNTLMDFNDNVLIEVKTKWERILNEEVPYNVVKNAFF